MENNIVREITPKELKAMLEASEQLTLVDVREPFERDIASIGGELIPLAEIVERHVEIPRNRKVIVYCRSGGRSGQAVSALQHEHAFDNLYNLSGGILRWIDEVDPTLKKY